MDISIIEKISCTVLENGATTINSQILYDIVRKIDDNSEIEIISNNGKLLSLRSEGSRFSLACLPKEDFPIIEKDNIGVEISLNSKIFFKLIDKTKFAISNEETRYFLNGLYFNVTNEDNRNIVTLVGTDGHRLAKFSHGIEAQIDQVSGVIIPKKTIYELSKLLSEIDKEIKISISSNKIVFFIEDIIFISKKGVIVDFVKNALPMTEKIHSSKKKVKYVLEINSGMIERYNINVGDKIKIEY